MVCHHAFLSDIIAYLPHFRVAPLDAVNGDGDERVEDYARVCPAVVGVLSHPFCSRVTIAEGIGRPVRVSGCVWKRKSVCVGRGGGGEKVGRGHQFVAKL